MFGTANTWTRSLGQGSTFLWTEHYQTQHPAGIQEWARHGVFALALLVLAAGAAGFLTFEGPASQYATFTVILNAL